MGWSLLYKYTSLYIAYLSVTSSRLVRSYLLHYGYEDTLNSFDLANKTTQPPVTIAKENGFDEQDIVYALNQRKTLRQVIFFSIPVAGMLLS